MKLRKLKFTCQEGILGGVGGRGVEMGGERWHTSHLRYCVIFSLHPPHHHDHHDHHQEHHDHHDYHQVHHDHPVCPRGRWRCWTCHSTVHCVGHLRLKWTLLVIIIVIIILIIIILIIIIIMIIMLVTWVIMLTHIHMSWSPSAASNHFRVFILYLNFPNNVHPHYHHNHHNH